MEYRKASAVDVPEIARLADKIWKAHYISIIGMEQIEYMLKMMYSEESLLRQMKEGHAFTILSLQGRDIGYISLSMSEAGNYFLHKFYVDVNEQGRGLGTRLLKHILEELPRGGTIRLTVNRQNYKAINFYFKNGFVISEVADFDIGNGYFMNDFVMTRKLS